MWIFGFSPGVCPTEPSNLVFFLECLVSNGRQALLWGIRLGGSTIDSDLFWLQWRPPTISLRYDFKLPFFKYQPLPCISFLLKFLAHRSLLVASRYYRTMLESVYLQKTWLSLSKSAECHLSWIHNHSNRATYITSHINVLTFCNNGLSNFTLEKVFEALFPHLFSDTTCGRTA